MPQARGVSEAVLITLGGIASFLLGLITGGVYVKYDAPRFPQSHDCFKFHHSYTCDFHPDTDTRPSDSDNQCDYSVSNPLTISTEFFVREKRRHYRDLRTNVFEPLKNYRHEPAPQNIAEQLKFQYDISSIRSSPYFDKGSKHLSKDIPGIMDSIGRLETLSKNLAKEVEEYVGITIPALIRNQLSSIRFPKDENQPNKIVLSDIDRPDSIYPTQVTRVVIGLWRNTILAPYFEGKTLEDITANLRDLNATNPEPDIFNLEGVSVANLSSNSAQKDLVGVVDSLRKDRTILDQLVGFAERKKGLRDSESQISKQVEGIINLIETKDYRTTLRCCPKFWKLLFRGA